MIYSNFELTDLVPGDYFQVFINNLGFQLDVLLLYTCSRKNIYCKG
jgi:hypothetical protein